MLKVFHHVNTIRIASAAMLVDLATVETVEGNQQGAEQVVSYADIHLQQDGGQIQWIIAARAYGAHTLQASRWNNRIFPHTHTEVRTV